MTFAKILATASVLSIALSTGAFAANDYTPSQSIEMVGVDVTQAGTTDESRMAFWKSMPADQASTAKQKCQQALGEGGSMSSDQQSNVYQFCKLGLQ